MGQKIIHYLQNINFWLLALFFAGFGFYFIITPKCSDDYWFLSHFKDWFTSQGIMNPEDGGDIINGGFPLKEIWTSWQWRFYHDNIRLANCLGVIMLLFPKWIGSSLTWVAFIYAIVRSFRLAGLNWLKTPYVGIGLILYYLALPWYEQMGSLIYQYNYVVPMGLSVLLLCRIGRPHVSQKQQILTFLLALAVGMWHEGFTAPIFGALAIMVILRRSYRTRTIYLVLAGLGLGILILFSSPAMQERAEINLSSGYHMDFFIGLLTYEWCPVLALILMLVTFGFHGRNNEKRNDRLIEMTLICIISIGIYVKEPLPRVSWVADFYSVPVSVGCISVLLKAVSSKCIALMRMITLAALCPVYMSLFMVCRETLQLRKAFLEVVETLARNNEETYVFAGIRSYPRHSFLLNRFPVYQQRRMFIYLSYYYTGSPDTFQVAVIPSELETYTECMGKSIGGAGNVREYQGEWIAPFYGSARGECNVRTRLDYGKGYRHVTLKGGVFKSKSDGRTYLRLDPNLGWYLTYVKRLQQIDSLKVKEFHIVDIPSE